jgi:HD-GYP domain-containing protein (c-di-GMP phosphodiesterase class II)
VRLRKLGRLVRRERTPEVEGVVDVLIERARGARSEALAGGERIATLALAAGFVVATVVVAIAFPSDREVDPLVLGALLLAYAAASRVEFEIGGGSAVPTQVVFVPSIVLLPPGLVPVVVVGGLVAGELIEVVRGDRHLQRLLTVCASSNFALAPAAIVGLAGEPALTWESAGVYVGALVGGSLLDAVNALAHQWLAAGVRPALQLRLMAEVYLVDAALVPIGLMTVDASRHTPLAPLGLVPFVGILSWFARERRRRIDKALELGRAYRGTAFLLGDVVEADDAYTGSHSREVVELVLGVADRLGLAPAERQRAEFAALLHDIGKIRVPAAIINKPGPLSPEERATMDRHTIEGQLLLERVGGLLGEVGTLVRSCHERWDGKGYPDRLIADEIPLIARIVCCCDAYNAMTTDRSYRRALSAPEAIAELRANAGTQFDPLVVRALIEVVSIDLPGPAARLADAA